MSRIQKMDNNKSTFVAMASSISAPILSFSILVIACIFIVQVYQGACLTLFGAMECPAPSTPAIQQPATTQYQSVSTPINIAFDVIANEFEQEKRSMVSDYIVPVIELQDAIQANDEKKIELAKVKIENNISRLSLDAYQAARSPFVPPKNKTQFLCDNAFALIYHGLYGNSSTDISMKLNGRRISMGSIDPGYKGVHKAGYKELTLTYLEYNKKFDGPIIKYECSEAD